MNVLVSCSNNVPDALVLSMPSIGNGFILHQYLPTATASLYIERFSWSFFRSFIVSYSIATTQRTQQILTSIWISNSVSCLCKACYYKPYTKSRCYDYLFYALFMLYTTFMNIFSLGRSSFWMGGKTKLQTSSTKAVQILLSLV